MTTAITVRDDTGFSLTPTNLAEAMELAKLMADSEFVPNAYRGKPGNVLVAVQMGHEVGLAPMAALQSIAVINGKPGLYGDSGKAILLSHGCTIDEDDTVKIKAQGFARCKITRPNGNVTERTFSIEDAKSADLLGKSGPWKQYQSRQMAWRAFWFAARDGCADMLKGIPGAEEVRDIPPERDMGTAQEVNGADKVKSALGHGAAKATAKPGPTLNNVLLQIQRAETAEDMTAAAAECTKLANDDDKAIARKGYSERLAALKKAASEAKDLAEAQANGIDIGTGEITQAESIAAANYAAVMDGINKAATLEDLDLTRSQIKGINDETQKAELNAAASARLKAIKAAAKGE